VHVGISQVASKSQATTAVKSRSQRQAADPPPVLLRHGRLDAGRNNDAAAIGAANNRLRAERKALEKAPQGSLARYDEDTIDRLNLAA
jgi:hypothetical protein